MKLPQQEDILRRYLLGQLPEQEQARIEGGLFQDDDLFDQLQAIKGELADDYARGELSAGERQQFERRFLASTAWREQVQFSKALAVALAESESESPVRTAPEAAPWWQSALAFVRAQSAAFQFAMTVAMLALLVGGLWMASKNRGLRQQLEQNRQAQAALEQKQRASEEQLTEERARSEQSTSQLELERQQRAQLQQEHDALEKQLNELPSFERPVVSLGLFPGIRGSDGEPKRIIVPREAGAIDLKLYFEGAGNYESYRAELRTAGGRMIWSKDGLSVRKTASSNAAVLRLPATLLASGEYEVALSGGISRGQFEDVGYYYFSALKR